MSVRHLLVLFVFSPVALVGAEKHSSLAPVQYAAIQPPMQPAAEPAPEPNPTVQPPQPAAEPTPEPNPTSQPSPVQPPAPVIRTAPEPAPQQPAAPVVRTTPKPSSEAPEPTNAGNSDGDHPRKSEKAETSGKSEKDDNDRPVNAAELHNITLWHNPGNISSLDLLYGQGGQKGVPAPPFTFESEDMNGTNPKFDARDAKDHKWRVKLGPEARPEVVASRLLWATGYYVNDDYVLASADIQGIHMKRDRGMIHNGQVTEARFARKPSGQKKIGIWKWKENPFMDTREFNGLRVMMAVMNNWDLKDVNNAVFEDSKTGKDIFLTSDIGATFGTNGLSWTNARSKGSIDSFKDSKFITKTTDTTVSFGTPKPPTARLIESFGLGAKDYANRAGMEWIGRDVPIKDARWIASLLKQLSHQQLVDAFRAGHFPPDQIDAYVQLVESRIQELSSL
jgi:hypothetical protein